MNRLTKAILKDEKLRMSLEQQSAVNSLKPILAFIYPYKWTGVLALMALVLTAIASLSLGQGLKWVVDHGFVAESKAQLRQGIIVMIVLIGLLAIGTFARFYLMSWLGERISADLRKAVFNRIVTLDPSFFEENRSGEIMSRLTTDTQLLQSIIGSSFSMAIRSSLMFLGGITMLFFTSYKLSLFVLVCVPLILLPMMVFGRKVKLLSKRSQSAIADIGTYAGEIIRNIKVVQGYTHEEKEKHAFSEEVEGAFCIAKRRILQRSFLVAVVILLTFTAISMMLWVGGMDVLSGKISEGELGAFIFYAIIVAMSVATISEVYGELQRAAGATSRLVELLSVESHLHQAILMKSLPVQANPVLEFKQVEFYYPAKPMLAALSQISFEINRGQVVAFVGTSGAGKTTLFELIQRFYDPQKGQVRIHGCNVTSLSLKELRQITGVVSQQAVLFSTDVWHNIRYGNPSASDEEVIDAAKKAHAHEFIQLLPKGYDSDLGEQGVRLSVGQKQRITLARAILKDPQILLLDEATSALDAESEYHVQAALRQLMEQRTTLIIAHRLATVMHADMIVVMDKGKIIDKGTHHTLLKTSVLYQRLCQLQFERANDLTKNAYE